MLNNLTGVLSLVPPPSSPVSGYTLWLDASDTSTITSSGGDVSQWNDKSGNGRNFTQGISTNRPKTGTRTINGLNTIDFDGSNDFLVCASSTTFFNYLHNSTGATVFFVGIVDNTASNKTMLCNNGGSSTNFGIRYEITSSEQDFIAVSNGVAAQNPISASGSLSYTTGSAYYTSTKIDSANATAANRYKISLNGAAEVGSNANSFTPSASNATNNLHLGIIDDGVTFPYDGCFGEILFYSGILSADDITSTRTYLANKWGF
jgi:hypothetical protein